MKVKVLMTTCRLHIQGSLKFVIGKFGIDMKKIVTCFTELISKFDIRIKVIIFNNKIFTTQLPKSISKRLSENSSSKEVFDKSKGLYKIALYNSGFYEHLIYHQDKGNINQQTPTQNNMVQSAISKNCDNEYWQELFQVNQPPLPENVENL